MPKEHKPRRGSLAFSPRVRAKSPVPHVRSWPETQETCIPGIGGYIAGMTHVMMIDDRKTSLTYNQTIAVPVTVVEVPPVFIFGIRLYGKGPRGLKTIGEIWNPKLPENMRRKVTIPKKVDLEKRLEEMEKLVKDGKVQEIRVLCCTQPWLTSLPKKKPDIYEVPISGPNLLEKWEKAKSLLGKELRVSEVFREGEYIDVIAITKGKGFQGPVKRWGVKILPRKTEGGRRQVGTLGPWHPAKVMWTVPQAGQMGYHQRTELNKRILKIGENGSEVTPAGGFLRYGPVKTNYVLIAGSVPGPTKRFVMLRKAIRGPREPLSKPVITYISLSSKQGA